MMIDAAGADRYAGVFTSTAPQTVNNRERIVIAAALLVTCTLIGIDLFNDSGEGVASWHVVIEAGAGLVSLVALFVLLRGTFTLRRRLDQEIASSSALRQEAARWRAEARRHVEGLAMAIDQQLTKWRLTEAEKEVAFLLLKGYGLKEIARARNTSEKTARAQSTAIYAKAGLSGRSELAAFFLEDLLVPQPPGPG
jgi:DNA-binding CsgD family transcriptional regulator